MRIDGQIMVAKDEKYPDVIVQYYNGNITGPKLKEASLKSDSLLPVTSVRAYIADLSEHDPGISEMMPTVTKNSVHEAFEDRPVVFTVIINSNKVVRGVISLLSIVPKFRGKFMFAKDMAEAYQLIEAHTESKS